MLIDITWGIIIASCFLYFYILNIVFFRIHSFANCTRYNLFAHRKKSYQLLICKVAKNLPVLELLNHFIKSSTVAYKRAAYKKNLVYDVFWNVWYSYITSTCKKLTVDSPSRGNLVNVVPWQGQIWLISKITWPCQYYVINACGGLRLDSLPRDVFAV